MMQPFILISILVLALVVGGVLVFVALVLRKSSANFDIHSEERHPKGFWISIGMSTGVGFGVALGLAFDSLALGIAIGAAVGAGIGAALEQKNKDKVRPLTEQEQKIQGWGVALGLIVLFFFGWNLHAPRASEKLMHA